MNEDTNQATNQNDPWQGFELIHAYTREQAIEDGVLVDVSTLAKEAGLRYPVAVTRNVWDGYIVPDERARKLGQSETGRLWDLLWMFSIAARHASIDTILFRLYFIMKERQRRLITMKAMIAPGDNGEPVITIMLPEED